MFSWFKSKRTSDARVKVISDIRDSEQVDAAVKRYIKELETNEPIPCNFKYTTSIRCGLGFKYKSYDIDVELTEVSSEPLYVSCKVCGNPVRLYTVEDVMSYGSISRMATDTLYNQMGKGLDGHSLGMNIKISEDIKQHYQNNVSALVIARNNKVLEFRFKS